MDHANGLRQPIDRILVVCLALLTLLSRIPFRSHILYHWDSVNFANGMHHFDVLQEHPQPPGYIVYVWLCRLVNLLLHDANATMVWISMVASSLAVVILYLLGRDIWNRRVGLVAALSLASSPLFWFYGEIALPHTLDTLLVLLAVWLLYRVRQGEEQFLWPAVVVLGIAGGVRQQTLVFLLPLTLYVVWRTGWKRVILAGLLGAGICLIWFLPLMVSCGGIKAYLEKMSTFSTRFQNDTSILMGAGWSGVAYNLRKLGLYTLYGLGAATVPLGLHGAVRLAHRRWPRSWDYLAFLGLWMLPTLLFYSLVHMGQQGLVFIFLPVLLLLGAVGLDRLLTIRQGRMAVAALLVAAQAAVFCLVPEYPLGPGTQRLLTRDTVVNSDRYYADRFAAIREGFSPESTVILAANWDHVQYYLSEHNVLPFIVASEWRVGAGLALNTDREQEVLSIANQDLSVNARGEAAVVLFDDDLNQFNASSAQTQYLALPNGDLLAYLLLQSEDRLHYGPNKLVLLRP